MTGGPHDRPRDRDGSDDLDEFLDLIGRSSLGSAQARLGRAVGLRDAPPPSDRDPAGPDVVDAELRAARRFADRGETRAARLALWSARAGEALPRVPGPPAPADPAPDPSPHDRRPSRPGPASRLRGRHLVVVAAGLALLVGTLLGRASTPTALALLYGVFPILVIVYWFLDARSARQPSRTISSRTAALADRSAQLRAHTEALRALGGPLVDVATDLELVRHGLVTGGRPAADGPADALHRRLVRIHDLSGEIVALGDRSSTDHHRFADGCRTDPAGCLESTDSRAIEIASLTVGARVDEVMLEVALAADQAGALRWELRETGEPDPAAVALFADLNDLWSRLRHVDAALANTCAESLGAHNSLHRAAIMAWLRDLDSGPLLRASARLVVPACLRIGGLWSWATPLSRQLALVAVLRSRTSPLRLGRAMVAALGGSPAS